MPREDELHKSAQLILDGEDKRPIVFGCITGSSYAEGVEDVGFSIFEVQRPAAEYRCQITRGQVREQHQFVEHTSHNLLGSLHLALPREF